MQIRKLTTADSRAFRELRAEMCTLHPEAFGQTPEEVMAMPEEKFLDWISPNEQYPEKFVLAALEGNHLLGSVGFRREDSVKERHRGYVWTVYVRKEARGKGISKRLLEQVIEEARRLDGLEILVLSVALTQTSARTLYTSLGFFTIGLNQQGYKLPDGRYIDHEEMMLRL